MQSDMIDPSKVKKVKVSKPKVKTTKQVAKDLKQADAKKASTKQLEKYKEKVAKTVNSQLSWAGVKKEAPFTTATTIETKETSIKDEVTDLKKALLEKEQQLQKVNLAMNNVNKFSTTLGLQKPFETAQLNSTQEKPNVKKFSSINKHQVSIHALLAPMHKDVYQILEEEKNVSKFVKTLIGHYLPKEVRSFLSAHGSKQNPSIDTKIPRFTEIIDDLVFEKFGGVPKSLITRYINECCGEARNNGNNNGNSAEGPIDLTNTDFIALRIDEPKQSNKVTHESDDESEGSSDSSRIASEISSDESPESELESSESERENEKHLKSKKRKNKEKPKKKAKKIKIDDDN